MSGLRRNIWGLCLATVVLVGGAFSVPADAAEHEIRMTATIDGRDLAKVDANRPLRLAPNQPLLVKISVRNLGSQERFIRSVRLSAKVIGLTFVSYDTRVDLQVGAGQTGERVFSLDVADLSGQATGLLPGRLQLLDQKRDVLAVQRFSVDVRGSLRSIYGLFGLLIAAITVVMLVTVLIRLVGQRLPPNRWRRAMRFAVPGIGIGLTLTFTLSALRLLTPSARLWLPLVIAFFAALFVIGYLTPAPLTPEELEEDEGGRPDQFPGQPYPSVPSGDPYGTVGQPGFPPPPR